MQAAVGEGAPAGLDFKEFHSLVIDEVRAALETARRMGDVAAGPAEEPFARYLQHSLEELLIDLDCVG